LVIVMVTLPALALSVFLSYASWPLGLAAIARLPDAPPAAAALDVAAPVPVPAAAEEVAPEAEVAPPPDELEPEEPPHAATPSASTAALRRRADCFNMWQISFVFGVGREDPGSGEAGVRACAS
jgi:hypothetical protein